MDIGSDTSDIERQAVKKLREITKKIAQKVEENYDFEFFDSSLKTEAVSEKHIGTFVAPAIARNEKNMLTLFAFYTDAEDNVIHKKELYTIAIDDLIEVSKILGAFLDAIDERKRHVIEYRADFMRRAAESYERLEELLEKRAIRNNIRTPHPEGNS